MKNKRIGYTRQRDASKKLHYPPPPSPFGKELMQQFFPRAVYVRLLYMVGDFKVTLLWNKPCPELFRLLK